MNLRQEYDAIVVGTGISGGWTAKELCENGLKTLVLERGRMIEHIKDYTTANLDPWDLPNGGATSRETRERKPKQHRTGFVTTEARQHFFVDDIKHPYNEDRRFDWIRGYHVGGRSLTWGRHSYRLSNIDFGANKKEGIAVDWPVRYKDIEPWYSHVEEYIGVCGENLGLKQLPDFGNWCIKRPEGVRWGECLEEYPDKYEGVQLMMTAAKAVSAKSYDFDTNGNETTIDYVKMLQIVKDAGYKGFIGVEYEGSRLSEEEGVITTKKLLLVASKKLN